MEPLHRARIEQQRRKDLKRVIRNAILEAAAIIVLAAFVVGFAWALWTGR